MTVYTIHMTDLMRFRELRTVVWDDEAGTVEGDHSGVPWIRSVLNSETPYDLGTEGGDYILNDPAHDPRDFLAVLGRAHWPILDDDLERPLLPKALRDIEATEPVPWPPIYETLPDGTRRELVLGVDYLH